VSQPELLKFALQRQLRRLGCVRKLAEGRVLSGWADVVGPQIAAKATAESLTQGTLTVVVPEATWRQELSLSRPRLIEQLNAHAERVVVRDIFFVAVSRRKDR
jgi:predicted nucleic acid-binding Zn ribbon protein